MDEALGEFIARREREPRTSRIERWIANAVPICASVLYSARGEISPADSATSQAAISTKPPAVSSRHFMIGPRTVRQRGIAPACTSFASPRK